MKKEKSFTLIELLVAISIIALLTGIILVNLQSSREKARIAKGLHLSGQIQHALGAYAVGEWNFNTIEAGNKVRDISGNGNDGTVNGATLTSSLPGLVNALSFDGDDFVDCVNNASLNITGAITIEAWIKKSIVDYRGDITAKLTGGYNFLIHNASAQYRLYLQARDSGGINWIAAYSNPNAITDTNWHHVVVSYQRPTAKFYVDGKDWGSYIRDSDVQSTSGNFIISPLIGNPFKGLIDEVRIYNQALSAAQIQKHYAEGAKKYGLVKE